MTCESFLITRPVPSQHPSFSSTEGGGHIASTTDLELDSVFLHPAGEKSSGLEKSE